MYEPGVGPVASKHVGPVHHELHRPARFPRQQRRHRLQVDGNLAAEAAADFHRHDLHLETGILQQFRRLLPDGERALRAQSRS
jgi:hypothetical protein